MEILTLDPNLNDFLKKNDFVSQKNVGSFWNYYFIFEFRDSA